jgi:hypothetical protein
MASEHHQQQHHFGDGWQLIHACANFGKASSREVEALQLLRSSAKVIYAIVDCCSGWRQKMLNVVNRLALDGAERS